jgi:drug/metabolite transporter (DMT)-like permease
MTPQRLIPHRFVGPAYALAAALLFGVSTPLAKVLLGRVDPWMLAALLYLGSGIGLAVVRVGLRGMLPSAARDAALSGRDWLWFGAVILSGGVIGPVCLMTGLVTTPAATASLLLNLEGVATALLAWFAFRENFDRRIAAGMAAIVAGALLLSWPDSISAGGFAGPLLIAAACLAWGIDNNLTRKVSLSDPLQIAMWKGLVAGGVNLALALAQGETLPPAGIALGTGLVGLAGYGASIALFVLALRHLGTARTGAYFSTAPFIGALVAVLWLAEPLSPAILAAGALMGLGVWLHLTELHEHEHIHEAMEHSHRHRHDAHHQHEHDPGVDPDEPHTHVHTHGGLRHSHAHFPDAHHRHRH